MDEYIRLDTTIIAIDNLINEAATGTIARTLFKAKDTIYNQQRYAIDVQPVKYGTWENTNTPNHLRCSNCEITHFIAQYPHGAINYCPNCGADMRGDTQ